MFFNLLVALKLGIAAVTMHFLSANVGEITKLSVFQQLLASLFSICYAMDNIQLLNPAM